MLFAAIFVPNFAIQALIATEPNLRNHALALIEGTPPLLRVVAINEKARRAGVELGDTKAQAEMARVTVSLRSCDIEESAHKTLLNCVRNYSPRLQIKAADLVILDIDGMSRLFGNPQQIATKLHSALCKENLQSNVAVAHNPDTATILARGLVGATVLTDPKQLARLPVTLLDPSTDLLETIRLWGITTLGELAALDAIALSERFGQEGVTLHKLAQGEQINPFVAREPELDFSEQAELEHPIELLESLVLFISSLLERICASLQQYSFSTNEVHLTLGLDPSRLSDERFQEQQVSRSIKLPTPTTDSRLLLRLFQLDLQSHPPGAPVVNILLRAEAVRPRHVQQELFAPRTPDPDQLELTLARLTTVLGSGQLGSPELLDSHLPRGYAMTHFVPAPPSKRRVPDAYSQRVALRLFDPPKKAAIRLRSDIPYEVAFEGKRSHVIHHAGPWLSRGEWWTEAEWNRKEWDVQLQFPDGVVQDYRIFIDLKTRQGFVEGTYD